MKHLARLLSLLVLVGAGFFFTNCGSDGGGGDEKSEQEIQYDKLKGLWTVQTVDLDGDSWNDEFAGGELSLTSDSFSENGEFGYSFTVDGGVDTSPWPGNGSWKFNTSNPSNTIIRLDSEKGFDDLTMGYELSNSDETLEITFNLPDGVSFTIAGRTASVEGNWTFVFTK
ncbi:MAG TPA: hypothetical protein VGK59_06910 [Ohtaekwangia sp.]